jgi:hypothetical protein
VNAYWSGGLLVAFVVWSIACGVAGYKSESHICAEADAQHDLAQSQNTVAAQQHVITIVQKQDSTNQKIGADYAKTIAGIDSMYSAASLQPTPSTAVNDVPTTTPAASVSHGSTGAAKCPATAKRTLLTVAQSCDKQTAQLVALQSWVKEQAAVK